MKTVRQTGKDLMSKASTADRAVLQSQLDELEGLWNRTSKLCDKRTERLEDALKQVILKYLLLGDFHYIINLKLIIIYLG